MPHTSPATALSRITALASQRRIHEAFRWLHLNEQQIMRWQAELVGVPAPPFKERTRAEWLAALFRELNLEGVEIDRAGNVLGVLPANEAASNRSDSCILLSAHIDTIFPAETEIHPEQKGTVLKAPGACDNGAGVAGLLATAAALRHIRQIADPSTATCNILFAGNVGEEGEGDLRGIRYIYQHSPWRKHIATHIVLDGAGHELAVTTALGSRRFLATISGPGGHSWTDSGAPNPIVLLSKAIARLSEIELSDSPRTTLSVGTIEGGTSVNAIPQRAAARFDLRSTDPEQLVRIEVELHRAIEDVVADVNRRAAPSAGKSLSRSPVKFSIEKIGDRPAGRLSDDATILATLRAVDRHLGIRTQNRTASTDANIPLSLGVEAISIGAGGDGGSVHTTAEWYDGKGRELALRRILLLLLAMASDSCS